MSPSPNSQAPSQAPSQPPSPPPAEPLPSSTVVLVRDQPAGLELLLLQRATRDGGTSGQWVFPGGRVEASDEQGAENDVLEIARRTAIRETHEEAGVDIARFELQLISRWITPPISPKRFDTYFFAATAPRDLDVTVDGQEIRTHRWIQPADALALRDRGEVKLSPPTFVTLHWLLHHPSAEAALAHMGTFPVLTIRPMICPVENGAHMLYPGDAGYESGDPHRDGPRHRVITGPGNMRYERSEA